MMTSQLEEEKQASVPRDMSLCVMQMSSECSDSKTEEEEEQLYNRIDCLMDNA